MGNTLLTHKRCGGSIVLDFGENMKLIGPSYHIGTTGITSILFDIRRSVSTAVPGFRCYQCYKAIDNIMTEMTSVCLICGVEHDVRDLWVHTRFSIICTTCADKLLRVEKADAQEDQVIVSYLEAFGSKAAGKSVSLRDVLLKPVTI